MTEDEHTLGIVADHLGDARLHLGYIKTVPDVTPAELSAAYEAVTRAEQLVDALLARVNA